VATDNRYSEDQRWAIDRTINHHRYTPSTAVAHLTVHGWQEEGRTVEPFELTNTSARRLAAEARQHRAGQGDHPSLENGEEAAIRHQVRQLIALSAEALHAQSIKGIDPKALHETAKALKEIHDLAAKTRTAGPGPQSQQRTNALERIVQQGQAPNDKVESTS
jgi:hypothetical protein